MAPKTADGQRSCVCHVASLVPRSDSGKLTLVGGSFGTRYGCQFRLADLPYAPYRPWRSSGRLRLTGEGLFRLTYGGLSYRTVRASYSDRNNTPRPWIEKK